MQRNNRVLRLDHVELFNEDVVWLASVERLTLGNVKVPSGLLGLLEKLWWLDIRGGSSIDLEAARGVNKLHYLAVNQVRGLCDLSVVSEMTSLRFIDLFGLPQMTQLPSLSTLVNLERAQLGQFRGLLSLHGLLEAPQLRELVLVKKINVTSQDISEIINHAAIKNFSWFAEGVPDKVWIPVVDKIGLPPVPFGSVEDWFGLTGSPETPH